jgi:hypothetical protein
MTQEEIYKEEEKLSLKDYFAMTFTAYLTFIPLAIVVLFVMYLLIWVLFR